VSIQQWHVGQEVILRRPVYKGVEDKAALISRVGRTYVYIANAWGSETAFHADSGREKGVTHNAQRIFTTESLAAHDDLRAARDRLRGLTRFGNWADALTTDQLNRVSAILEESHP
jgi:hypothetical protein